MAKDDLWSAIEQTITATTGREFFIEKQTAVGGGCINSAYQLSGCEQQYFVKLNRETLAEMFAAESDGLTELAASRTIRVPGPICHGVEAGQCFLVLEFIPLSGSRGNCQQLLGEQLAAMHRTVQERYGWHRDNFIGSTPQKNSQSHDWVQFWAEQRIHFQLELAARSGFGGSLARNGEKLCADLGAFFSSYTPKASLVHGDLWGGNASGDSQGQPVIYDPACYFGDRETDLAMTELFGGFSGDFYAAYQSAWPLEPGYSSRKKLYNLYHILNHLNLFGGGYAAQAETMIGQLNAELH